MTQKELDDLYFKLESDEKEHLEADDQKLNHSD